MKCKTFGVVNCAVVFLLGCATLSADEADKGPHLWPQWRGPTRDGQVLGPAWPESLKEDRLRPRWRVELGPSYSGPIVAADRVFVTETKDKQLEVVRALDRKTGKELWRVEWAGALQVPFFARANGDWIRSTPAYDGERLYVAGMRDLLVCLDARDGSERWRVDFLAALKTPLPAFGFVCSPLVDGGAVYVLAGASVVKLDARTGKVHWRALQDEGGMNGSAFSSPVLAELSGKRQLLVQTRTKLAGLDPSSGAVLWSQAVPAMQGMNILTPIIQGGRVFTSSYGGRTFLYEVTRKDDTFTVAEAWNMKAQGYMSTPVVIGGHVYLHLRNQRVTCLDLANGQERWTTSHLFGKYWSMVARQDRVLALDERGLLYLLKANPKEFELLDSRRISDQETWGHLAVCGDEIHVRELNAITAYQWK